MTVNVARQAYHTTLTIRFLAFLGDVYTIPSSPPPIPPFPISLSSDRLLPTSLRKLKQAGGDVHVHPLHLLTCREPLHTLCPRNCHHRRIPQASSLSQFLNVCTVYIPPCQFKNIALTILFFLSHTLNVLLSYWVIPIGI